MRSLTRIFVLASCAAFATSSARAQEPLSQDDLVARLRQLEAEVAALRQPPCDEFVNAAPVCVCGPVPDPCGFYVGAQAAWSRPYIKNNPAIVLSSTDFATSATVVTSEFSHDYELTPRLYAGYTCDGTGIRGGWWELKSDDAESLVVPDIPGFDTDAEGRLVVANETDTLTVSQEFNLELAELEFTRGLQLGNSAVLVACGVRYVYYSDYIRERVTDAGGVLLERAWIYDSFEGLGPTLAIDWWHSCFDSGLVLHGNLRGTVAFGEQQQTSRLNIVVPAAFRQDTTRAGDVAQAIAEIDLGACWTTGNIVVGAGWRAQYWDDANEGDGFFFGITDVTPGLSDVGVNQFYLELAYYR
jgi:hypothetical protein